jgi:hypothetical protein
MSSQKKKRKVEDEAKDDDDKEDPNEWVHVFGGSGYVANCFEARAEIVRCKSSRSKRLEALRKLYMDIRGVCDELEGVLSEKPDVVVDMDPDELD